MNKKTIFKGMLIMGLIFILSGCAPSPKEGQNLLEDFIEYSSDLSFLEFNELEISKRQTNKENKEDIIYCTISGTGEYATHIYECILYYNLYDDGGWILDNVSMENTTIEDASISEEVVKNVFNENCYSIIPSNWDTIDYSLVDYVSMEELSYTSEMDFSVTKEPNPLGYTVSGSCAFDVIYNEYSGDWEYTYSDFWVSTQDFLGFDEGKWYNLEYISQAGSSLGEPENPYNVFEKNENNEWQFRYYYIGTDGQPYNKVHPIKNLNLLDGTFIFGKNDFGEVETINWESDSLIATTGLPRSEWIHER